ncbi:MAG: chorismate mutase [Alphaproteobacteria bacterium]
MEPSQETLEELRRAIDDIDDAIHDLLMRRVEVAERIGAVKGDGAGPFLRPAREAEVLRRLAKRHSGAFPRRDLVRIWREIMSSLVRLQGPFSMAVFDHDGAGCLNLARDQYGSHTPVTICDAPSEAVRYVASGEATVAVLPFPTEEDAEPWWPLLLAAEENGPQIIARIPFSPDPGAAGDEPQALAIAMMIPEPTDDDRSIVVIETDDDISRAKLNENFAAVGLNPLFSAERAGTPGRRGWLNLVECEGFILAEEERITLLVENLGEMVTAIHYLGAYAAPLGPDDMAPASGERS